MSRFGKVWIIGLACCGITGLLLAWIVGDILTRATNFPVALAPDPAKAVFIDEKPGLRLAGSYWPVESDHAPALLMLHGNGGSRGSLAKTARWLNENGYAVLTIDFRAHGESSAATKSFGLFESADARSAFGWLRQRYPRSKLGVIGFSLGGAASLLGRQGPLPADALVLEGVYPDIRHAIFDRLALRLGKPAATLIEPVLSFQSVPRFGVWPSEISPLRALSHVTEPVMIVGGENDENTPPAEIRAMFEAVKEHGQLWILKGVDHAELGRTMPDALKAALLDFLHRTHA